METEQRLSFGVDEELLTAINSRLGYGDSRSEWVREACRQRLRRERGENDDADEATAEN